MTAGHCIYGHEGLRYPEKITFSPGYNNGQSPYGTFEVKRGRVPDQYLTNKDWNYDVAVIKLSSPIGKKVGYFPVKYSNSSNTNLNKKVWITGYPSDKERKMYRMGGNIEGILNNRYYYSIDTLGGQSGSPIYYRDPDDTSKRICIGVHTHGIQEGEITDGTNSGVRINKTIFSWMKQSETDWAVDVEPPIFSDGSEFWP